MPARRERHTRPPTAADSPSRFSEKRTNCPILRSDSPTTKSEDLQFC
jgi:hypothetical protein